MNEEILLCRYCGREINHPTKTVCETCQHKLSLMPRFVQARDDLRELLGLERMGKQHG